jgi:orotidine-5'-phosphate decarboxylase
MSYVDLLKEKTDLFGSLISLGMDPVLEKIPLEGTVEEKISNFYVAMLDACVSEDVMPSTVKPNIAYFEQYGFEGLKALKSILEHCSVLKVPVVLDVKRGDIGRTSAAYARACFDFWKVDAVTLSPYMGKDVIDPFIRKDKGIYALCKTSNASASIMQDVDVGGKKFYEHVATQIVDWNVGAVVGATFPDELKSLSSFFGKCGKEIPLLIPGIGAQGGDLQLTLRALQESGSDIRIHRINSSSGINYAYLKAKSDDFAGSAVKELKRLNDVCKGFL